MALTLSHVVVHVRDLPLMLDFYGAVLGFAITDRGPLAPDGPEIVFMSQDPGEHHQLAMVPAPRGDGPPALNHMAFRVPALGDVKTLYERIVADGRGTQPRPLCHGNTWSIYFADPERNGIEIFCDTPWHVAQPQGQSWDMSADEATLLATTRAAFAGEPGFGPGDSYVNARARPAP